MKLNGQNLLYGKFVMLEQRKLSHDGHRIIQDFPKIKINR